MRRLVANLADVPTSVPCRVIAKLRPGVWRVIVGDGVGYLDGGVHDDWLEEELPVEVRAPNATFFVTLESCRHCGQRTARGDASNSVARRRRTSARFP